MNPANKRRLTLCREMFAPTSFRKSQAAALTAAILSLVVARTARTQQPTPAQTLPPLSQWLASGTEAGSPSAGPKSNLRYTIERAPTPSPEDEAAYQKITATMDEAVKYYNDYSTGLTKTLVVSYSPGTPTADGNSNGHLRFGRYTLSVVPTAMHEIAHAVGVGTDGKWGQLVVNGVFTGRHATAVLRDLTHDPQALVHADRMHFWPYGLNYVTEVKSSQDLINHCKMVSAIRQDLNEAR